MYITTIIINKIKQQLLFLISDVYQNYIYIFTLGGSFTLSILFGKKEE